MKVIEARQIRSNDFVIYEKDAGQNRSNAIRVISNMRVDKLIEVDSWESFIDYSEITHHMLESEAHQVNTYPTSDRTAEILRS